MRKTLHDFTEENVAEGQLLIRMTSRVIGIWCISTTISPSTQVNIWTNLLANIIFGIWIQSTKCEVIAKNIEGKRPKYKELALGENGRIN